MKKLNYVENNYFGRMSMKELGELKSSCQKLMVFLFFAFFMSIFFGVDVSALVSEQLPEPLSLDAIAASIDNPYSLLFFTGTIAILLYVVARIRYGVVVRIALKEYVPEEQRVYATSLEHAVRLVRAK